jgi:2-oxoglutarate dehydrogenase E1 component
MTQTADHTFLSGPNAEYIAHLYAEYLANPSKVDESWQAFFSDLGSNEAELLSELAGASWTPSENDKAERGFAKTALMRARRLYLRLLQVRAVLWARVRRRM